MNAQLIEKLDGRRYKYLLWQTIGFALFFAMWIAEIFMKDPSPCRIADYVVAAVSGLGCGIFFVALVRSALNERCIKSDPAIHAALCNELIRLYNYKAYKMALVVVVIVSLGLLFLAHWIPRMPGAFVAAAIFYSACMTLMISRLIYLRR